MVVLMVVPQLRWYQIDICQSASAYPTKAVHPANLKTRRYGEPGGRARPAINPAKIPTTTAYRNQSNRFRPIDQGPVGSTVRIRLGPCFTFSMNAGERISSRVIGRGTM